MLLDKIFSMQDKEKSQKLNQEWTPQVVRDVGHDLLRRNFVDASRAQLCRGIQCLQNKVEEFTQRLMCKVCLSVRMEVVFIPCKHLACCRRCSHETLTRGRRCPICRGAVSKWIYARFSGKWTIISSDCFRASIWLKLGVQFSSRKLSLTCWNSGPSNSRYALATFDRAWAR